MWVRVPEESLRIRPSEDPLWPASGVPPGAPRSSTGLTTVVLDGRASVSPTRRTAGSPPGRSACTDRPPEANAAVTYSCSSANSRPDAGEGHYQSHPPARPAARTAAGRGQSRSTAAQRPARTARTFRQIETRLLQRQQDEVGPAVDHHPHHGPAPGRVGPIRRAPVPRLKFSRGRPPCSRDVLASG